MWWLRCQSSPSLELAEDSFDSSLYCWEVIYKSWAFENIPKTYNTCKVTHFSCYCVLQKGNALKLLSTTSFLSSSRESNPDHQCDALNIELHRLRWSAKVTFAFWFVTKLASSIPVRDSEGNFGFRECTLNISNKLLKFHHYIISRWCILEARRFVGVLSYGNTGRLSGGPCLWSLLVAFKIWFRSQVWLLVTFEQSSSNSHQ